jgi:hypothetical protein
VALPRLVIHLDGTLQNTAPPKPRLVIRINGKNHTVHSDLDTESDSSSPEVSSMSENDEEEDYAMDSEFAALFGDDDTDDEFGPDWMFDNSEKPSKDPSYVFCPAPHHKQLLHLFTRHFCQHPFFPERLESVSWTPEQIRRNSVMEMYQFCFQRGLREVWGYMWTSWYSPKMWKLWAWSTLPELLSHLRTTMNVENFWKQLKHDNLHHILHPRLDQLVWILIHKVTPSYINRITELDPISRLSHSHSLTPFQKGFKTDWKKLFTRPIKNSERYTTNVDTWTCNCGQQKYNSHALCKHLVQAVNKPSAKFFQQVCVFSCHHCVCHIDESYISFR